MKKLGQLRESLLTKIKSEYEFNCARNTLPEPWTNLNHITVIAIAYIWVPFALKLIDESLNPQQESVSIMEKNAFSPEEIELSPNSPNSTINLAIIASYALIAMALASFFHLKTSFSPQKTPQNLTISSPDNPQSPYDSGKSSQVD